MEPQRIGRYRVLGTLGSGGQGIVYDAVLDPAEGVVGRRVALKVTGDGAALVREARLGGLLRHPNLVDCFEVGVHDGAWFVAMERCSGGSLAKRVLPPRAVVEVGLQVCAALVYAHEELGLVHLDLKPQNLLLEGAVVKVADLGTARAEEGAAPRFAGTPGYMAPEQRRGEPVDARADVFALGVVLHELATGRRPGDAPSDDRVTTPVDALEDPTAEVPRLGPPWLEPVLVRCLAPDRATRFASMGELAAALAGLDAPGATLAEIVGAADPVATDHRGFLGRVAELDALADALAEPGLVAVVGAPGIGKSALAREAARRFGPPAWSADLAEARDLASLLGAVAAALDIPLQPTADDDALIEQLGHAIAARGRSVGILDHVDHWPGSARVLERWRDRAAPVGVRLLVTSRRGLACSGERQLRLGELSPRDGAALVCARAAERGVAVAPTDPSVAALVGRLDGVPLALELAAGRVGVLPLAEVLDRLSLSFLRSGEGTLAGAVQWSLDQLDDVGRAALGTLAVFRGGFRADDAVAVLGDGADPAVLHDLVDRSLVGVRGGRHGILEPVRALAEAGLAPREREAAEERHGARFAARAAEAGETPLGAELENLVAACERACRRADGPRAVATLSAAWDVLSRRGPLARASELGDRVLAVPGLATAEAVSATVVVAQVAHLRGQPARASALLEAALASAPRDPAVLERLGAIRREQGRPDEARALLESGLALAEERGDRVLEARVLGQLGVAHREQGRTAEARQCYERALACVAGGLAPALEGAIFGFLGTLAAHEGRVAEAGPHLEAALARHRESGDRRQEAGVLGNLAVLRQGEGNWQEARRLLDASLALLRETGSRRMEAIALGNLGVLVSARGSLDEAERLYDAAIAIHREVHDPRAEGITLGNLAELRHHQGREEEAAALYEAALVLHREVGNRTHEGVACWLLGVLRFDQDRPGEAEALFEAALALYRQTGSRRMEGPVLADLGRIDQAAGRTARAAERYAAALEVHRRVQNRADEGVTRGRIADLRRVLGDLDGAERHLADAEALLDGIPDPLEVAALRCARAELALARGDREAARAAVREAHLLVAGRRVGGALARRLAGLAGLD